MWKSRGISLTWCPGEERPRAALVGWGGGSVRSRLYSHTCLPPSSPLTLPGKGPTQFSQFPQGTSPVLGTLWEPRKGKL